MESETSLESILKEASAAYSEDAVDLASSLCERGLAHAPENAELLHLQGLLLFRKGDFQNATGSIRKAMVQQPNQADFHNSLGVVLKKDGKVSEAIGAYQSTLSIKPNYAEALNNLGDAYVDNEQFMLAESNFRRAITFNRAYADAHYNLGNVLKEMGRLDEAISQFDLCLEIEGSHSGAHWNRSLTFLLAGNYQAGWPGHEWRFSQRNFPSARSMAAPLWQGESLEEKRLLIYVEQGLGDMLQFIRLIRPLLDQAEQVILECPSRFVALLKTFDERLQLIAAGSELPGVDYHLPLMSLGGRLNLSSEAIPENGGYLQVLPPWTDACSEKVSLPEGSGKRIGIQWQGDSNYSADKNRSVPLENWASLWKVKNVQWVSVQQGYGLEQLSGAHPVLNAGVHLDKGADGFVETAALLKQLDLFITTDTALVHLAGALNVPTWLILGEHPDWRWGLEGEQSPWYSTLRLFRQQERGEWSDVFEKIRAELESFGEQ